MLQVRRELPLLWRRIQNGKCATTANILEETAEGLFKSYEQNCLAVMFALQAMLLPPIP